MSFLDGAVQLIPPNCNKSYQNCLDGISFSQIKDKFVCFQYRTFILDFVTVLPVN